MIGTWESMCEPEARTSQYAYNRYVYLAFAIIFGLFFVAFQIPNLIDYGIRSELASTLQGSAYFFGIVSIWLDEIGRLKLGKSFGIATAIAFLGMIITRCVFEGIQTQIVPVSIASFIVIVGILLAIFRRKH